MTEHDRDALISQIVAEVVRRLRARETPPEATGLRLAVALSADVSIGVFQVMGDLKGRGFRFGSVACSERMPPERSAQALAFATSTGQERSGLSADTTLVLAPELALTDAAKLTHGILDDAVPKLLWKALASGVPVLASPGDGFSPDLPKPLTRLATEQRVLCQRLGVQWNERDALASAVAARVSSSTPAPTVHAPSTETRLLVTERMIAGLAEDTREFVVPSTTILTPLAYDMARRRGISIRRRS